MDTSHVYEIRIEGQLMERWSDWFEGLAIRNETDGESTLTGKLPDQAALYGVLNKLHNLNLRLVSVRRLSKHDEAHEDTAARILNPDA